ncbi:MAG: hypothetical protein G8345_22245, partial [Magnetococcales bacterium]|nr:hypothetical protein [Magnetococcales bacterium]
MNRPSVPMDSHWQSRYAKMVVLAEEAVMRIKPGQRVFLATGAGVPQTLVRALINQRS